MKIADVRTVVVGNPWKNWIYVVVETDEGLIGVGEATGGSETQPRVAAVEEIKHLIIGMDPRNVHQIFHKLYLTAFIKVTTAMAGIEMACWDILGKSLGVPVHTLLGGKVRENVRVYANGWYSGERTPEGFAEKASEVVAKGYTALKFDPFGDAHMQMSRKETAEAKALIGAVRDAVGDALQQHRLARFGRRDDEATLAHADRRHQINDARRQIFRGAVAELERKAFLREQRRQILEQHLVLRVLWRIKIDFINLE